MGGIQSPTTSIKAKSLLVGRIYTRVVVCLGWGPSGPLPGFNSCLLRGLFVSLDTIKNKKVMENTSYYTALARTVGKYEGLTKFLVESPDNTMTKEDIARRMLEILKEFKAATVK